MLKNRKVQIVGTAVLIIAAILVTLSAVRPPVSVFIPVTGSNLEGLAQYYRSERAAHVTNQKGQQIYFQSERVNAYPPKNNQIGLVIYHQSERTQAVNWVQSNDPYFKYHQSEWFGR